MKTAGAPITIAPQKTALVIIDMQNYFLSRALGRTRGPGHAAEDVLRTLAIPAARKAGIQVVHLTWGLTQEELDNLPPSILRGFSERNPKTDECETIGDEIGPVKLWNGQIVMGGRRLKRDRWNSDLYESLRQQFAESAGSAQPDVRFYKSRASGFWGGKGVALDFLREKGITTLLFAGMNAEHAVMPSIQDACDLGFDTVLLRDGCSTTSPDFARITAEYESSRWGFLSTCEDFAKGYVNRRPY
jgi:nicotinamidase-related amidase